MTKTDEGFILVTPYSEEEAPVVPDKETKKEAEKVVEEVTKKVEEKSETKLEES
ncbi:MAG: 50S ribosomal protein L31, partial [Nitrosopumilaceae archaeon]|nr:50S ribosomal protein L31 [Candidatus Kutchimonas denitrificans]NIU00416.1 50S ribosomal protein L31 [Nitrosopumilaceae archaeon]NIV65484.1 50S ribosomal protein L31 [Nitrosopumilaceae archaeon]NIX61018.1 50S ribosomal protein L31 [Nitrosopumilaceae archaeon]